MAKDKQQSIDVPAEEKAAGSQLRSMLRLLWRWQDGRQHSGYRKMLLAASLLPVPFDIYLLSYKKGSFIAFHSDPVPPGKRHYRCNIFLRHAEAGGQFVLREGCRAIIDLPRVQIFRPDLCPHAVTEVQAGHRLVLSIGWLRSD